MKKTYSVIFILMLIVFPNLFISGELLAQEHKKKIPAQPPVIKGKVVDAAGNPIDDARVFLGSPDQAYLTDADGLFSFFLDENQQWGTLIVEKAGFALGIANFHSDKISAKPILVTLEKEFKFSGKVIDRDGTPLEGVNIAVVGYALDSFFDNYFTAETDNDGVFTFLYLPTGKFNFTITREGFAGYSYYSLSTRSKEVLVTLYPPIRIQGEVVDGETGKPINGFRIKSGFVHHYAEFKKNAGTNYSVELKKLDTFVNYGAKYVKDYEVNIAAPGYLPKKKNIVLNIRKETDYRLDFKLKPTKPLSGVVKCPDGSPASNAIIIIPDFYPVTLKGGRDKLKDTAVAAVDGVFQFYPTLKHEAESPVLLFGEPGFIEATFKDLEKRKDYVLKPWGELTIKVPNLYVEKAYDSLEIARLIFKKGKYLSGFKDSPEKIGDGVFVFRHVPEGCFRVSIDSDKRWMARYGSIKAGEKKTITLGKDSHSIKAKVKLPDNFPDKYAKILGYELKLVQPLPLSDEWDTLKLHYYDYCDAPYHGDSQAFMELAAKKSLETLEIKDIAGDSILVNDVPVGKYQLLFSIKKDNNRRRLFTSKQIAIEPVSELKVNVGVINLVEDDMIKGIMLASQAKKGKEIFGKVVDFEGKPVPGTILSDFKFAGVDLPDKGCRTVTGKDGTFSLKGLPDVKKITCNVIPPSSSYIKYTNYVLPEPDDTGIVITLYRPFQISGTVKDASNGQPVPPEKYELRFMISNILGGNILGGKDGHYELRLDNLYAPPLNKDGFKITVNIKTPFYFQTSKIFKGNFGQKITYDFKLEKGIPAKGRIVNPDGTPCPDALIILFRQPKKQGLKLPSYQPDASQPNIWIENGRIIHFLNNDCSVKGKADKDGSYYIMPFKDGEFDVLLSSSQGYALLDGTDFMQKSEIKLAPWAIVKAVGPNLGKYDYFQLSGLGLENFILNTRGHREADGNILFKCIAPGYFNITAHTKDGAISDIYGRLKDAETTCEVKIPELDPSYEYNLEFKLEYPDQTFEKRFYVNMYLQPLLPEKLPEPKFLPDKWGSMSDKQKYQWFGNLRNTPEGLDLLVANPYPCSPFMVRKVGKELGKFGFNNLPPGDFEIVIIIYKREDVGNPVKDIRKIIKIKSGGEKRIDLGEIIVDFP